MWKSIIKYLQDFFTLFYPNLCSACGNHLYDGEECICIACRMTLPYTLDEQLRCNNTYKLFLGKVKIEAASSLFYFKKKSRVQNLLHQLKYKNHVELGRELGNMHGHQLRESELFQNIDYVVPIPLHPDKLKLRGYNQAALIAIGYAEAMNIKYSEEILVRDKFTETQTHKSRFERYENMESVFSCGERIDVMNKSILIVDDVITTGSTIESSALTLLNAGANKIYIASIAIA